MTFSDLPLEQSAGRGTGPTAGRVPWLTADVVRDTQRVTWRLLIWSAALVAATGIGSLAPGSVQGAVLPGLLAVLALALVHVAIGALARRWRRAGQLKRNVVVVGAGEQGQRFVEHLAHREDTVRLIGVFDDRASRVPGWVGHYPVLGTIDDLITFASHHPIDEVVLALPWTAEERIAACLEKLRRVPASVRLCPDLVAYRLSGRKVETIAGVPLLQVQLLPFVGWPRILKWLEDTTLAGIAVLVCAPVLAGIALLVRLSGRGPLLVRELRRDFSGGVIGLHAYRAEGTLGALLARTGLARLPRLLDVLSGRLSLVGPQPHRPTTALVVRERVDDALARYRVKPGLVSLADLELAGEELPSREALERRILLDRAYVERWSPALDARILARALLLPAAA